MKVLLATSLFLAVFLVAATGSSVQIATALAGVVTLLSPFLLRYVKLDGPQMAAFSYVTAFVIAAVAGYLSGEFTPDTSSAGGLLTYATALYGLQQVVFQLLKDNATVGPYLTGAKPQARRR